MSLSKTRAKKKEQVLEAAAATQATESAPERQSAGGDVATLAPVEQEPEAAEVATIGGQTTGPLQLSAEQGGEYGEDVGGELGEGGFFGWLGGLFGWDSGASFSPQPAGTSTAPRSAAGFTPVRETQDQSDDRFEEEEWKRAEETQFLDYDKKQRTRYTGRDGATRTITTQQTESSDLGRHSSVASELGPFADKEKTTKWSGSNKVGSEIRVDDSRTVGDVTYGDYWKAGAEGSYTKDGDTHSAGAKVHGGFGTKTSSTDADGVKTTLTSDHDLSLSGESIRGKKDDHATQDYGVGVGYGYTSGEIVERVTEDGTKVQEKSQDSVRGDLGYRTDKGISGGLTFEETTQTRSVAADGTPITTGKHTDATTISADRRSVGVGNKVTDTHSERVDKLGQHTRLTTTLGKTETEAGARAGKDEDGHWYAEANAGAKASLYEQKIQHKWDHGGGEAEASWNAVSGEANAKGRATITEDAIKIGGNASAKATLIGGNARIEAPTFGWKLLGEEVDVAVTAGVSAAVLAEAHGNIDLDISKGENLGVEVGGGGKAFAGAKAGVEVGAKLRWRRQPDYTQLVKGFAKSLPGGVDDWLVDKVPDATWTEVSRVLVGSGKSDLLTGKAGVEGSAGVGGEAKFGLSLSGGKINVSGALSGTVGLGVGVHTDLILDAIDGVRFAGVLFMRGTEWLVNALEQASDWYDQAVDIIQAKIDEYMEAEKAEGGISGALATAADWIGDDLFDLW
jgi:hypothetical protein